MADVIVEYRTSRSAIVGRKRLPKTLAELDAQRTRKVTPSNWTRNGGSSGGARNVEAKARWLIHQHGLVEDAINTAYRHMVKYNHDEEEPAFVFWRGVYKWLRRHEDLAKRSPQLVGCY